MIITIVNIIIIIRSYNVIILSYNKRIKHKKIKHKSLLDQQHYIIFDFVNQLLQIVYYQIMHSLIILKVSFHLFN